MQSLQNESKNIVATLDKKTFILNFASEKVNNSLTQS